MHAYLVDEFVNSVYEECQLAINICEDARDMADKPALRDAEWLAVPNWGDAPSGKKSEAAVAYA